MSSLAPHASLTAADRFRGICGRLLAGAPRSVEDAIHGTAARKASMAGDANGFKVLLVVAHPDDESECAAVLYRLTHEFWGTADQLIVTNGEGGSEFVAPAQAYYGLPLAQRQTTRNLVKIRRQEVLRAARIQVLAATIS